MYITRHIEKVLTNPAFLFKVMAVSGARQTGKTTVIEKIFEEKEFTKVELDNLSEQTLAKTNPGLFIEKYPTPLFIDEAQYAPELFPYIKMKADKLKQYGSYFLSGSQKHRMMKNVTESLAGRVGVFELMGLSMREIAGDSFSMPFAPTEQYVKERKKTAKQIGYGEIWKMIHRGSYPELYSNPQRDWEAFYNSYVNTYIDRDIQKEENITNTIKFYRFMQVVASISGNLLNLESIMSEVGIARQTCEHWLSVLQATNIIYLLPPYHGNLIKRAVKTPKIYFLDTGLMAFLTKWHTAEQIETGAMSGAFLETFVLGEILKSFYNAGKDPRNYLYFYRDKDKNEIDFVIYYDGKLHPVEVKKKDKADIRDTRAFRFAEKSEAPARGEGAIIALTPDYVPLTELDAVLPISFL